MSCLCSSFLPTNSQTSDNPRSSPYVSDHATRYFGSVGSDFVHAASCSKARNIPKINRVYYDSVRAAVNDGRVRCADCLSSSPNKNSSTSSDSPTYKPVTPLSMERLFMKSPVIVSPRLQLRPAAVAPQVRKIFDTTTGNYPSSCKAGYLQQSAAKESTATGQ